MAALLLERLEEFRAARALQQASAPQIEQLEQQPAGRSTLGAGEAPEGAAALGNTALLASRCRQVVAQMTLAGVWPEAEQWPEARLREYLAEHQLVTQERLDQCRDRAELMALCREIGGDKLAADSGATAAAAGSRADAAVAAGKAAEPLFPAVLPRDQAALRCAACGVGREQGKLKECTGCRQVFPRLGGRSAWVLSLTCTSYHVMRTEQHAWVPWKP